MLHALLHYCCSTGDATRSTLLVLPSTGDATRFSLLLLPVELL